MIKIFTKYILFFFFIFVLQTNLYSQKETYNWYFGERAGITFLPDGKNPRALTNAASTFNQLEGVATISDSDGNLLFYTDGNNIWDRRHYLMPNGGGLMGNFSATQSAVIVPQPERKGIYYVFTVDAIGGGNGCRYSIVDMSLNNGFGDIMPKEKNILLFSPAAEKITAVVHRNNIDIWVITHEFLSNRFRVYLLTRNGLNAPIIQAIGSVHGKAADDIFNSIGYMKASPDGKKIALAICKDSKIEIFDFNNANGTLSNPISITDTKYINAYGIEFSQDVSKLYVSTSFINFTQVFQLNLRAGSRDRIAASAVAIGNPASYYGALQLGPDWKIYVSRKDESWLAVINNPNATGAACGYSDLGVNLMGRKAQLGLPTFIQSYFSVDTDIFTNSPICEGQTLEFEAKDTQGATYRWTGPNNFNSNQRRIVIPNAKPNLSGVYQLIITVSGNNYFDSVYIQVNPKPIAKINPIGNIIFCEGDSVVLEATQGKDYFYKWSTDETSQKITVKRSGDYSLIVTNEFGCSDTASIKIIANQNPKVKINVQGKTKFCLGDSAILSSSITGTGYQYNWSTGEKTRQIIVKTTGRYFLTLTSPEGCKSSDSIDIVVSPIPIPIITVSGNSNCDGDTATLGLTKSYLAYLWSTGETSPNIKVHKSGRYSVSVVDSNNCSGETFIDLVFNKIPDIELIGDTLICVGEETTISTKEIYATYLWSTGENTSSIKIAKEGSYSLRVIDNNGCSNSITFNILRYDLTLEAEDLIDFDSVPGNSVNFKELIIKNKGKYDFTIKNIRILNSQSAFELEEGLTYPKTIKSSDQTSLKVYFKPITLNSFADSILIEIDNPCKIEKIIQLRGTSVTNTLVFVPDTVADVGTANFKIPIYSRKLYDFNLPPALPFELTLSFDQSYYALNENNPYIVSSDITGNIRRLKIEGIAQNLSLNNTVIAELIGLVCLGDGIKTPIKIEEFNWKNQLMSTQTQDGSLEIRGVCQPDIARVKPYILTKLNIVNNNFDNDIIAEIKSELKGNYYLSIFNINGVVVETISWNKSDEVLEDKRFNLNLSQYVAGTYFIRLISPDGFQVKILNFIK
ncbi:MAG: hypothetical protein N2319_09515 [Candidatus Kapabacteria bacterium]|nr:hypothetical protein [Candidatus Kapabacteria bacterium]